MTKRRILKITGPDARDFLQGLVTNDVERLSEGLVYAALLTPQGKYIADFFLVPAEEGILLDVAESLGDMLSQRLTMYKLRANVTIETAPLHLHRGVEDMPEDGFADPRHPALGWRAYRETPQEDDSIDWTALRVAHLIPETGVELTPDTFILEVGFERLSGVDFRKGCYVGQEVTARMKHKTDLRKGLAQVSVSGPAEVGTEILSNGKVAGTLLSRSADRGLAYLRYDRAVGDMAAGDATVMRTDA
ncbi:folate-binding protein [uncultured Roseobacter sp.]|uniref:CAF17-like 4Fe-4S cluster assembly/insertion protein YgfZ n=1 Tax=uncultured Roseobacter sp. TaxID=114847 RepID=UPI0026027879|nr:folate-binding protein [uncultured Roseobacter sp.]